MLYIGDGDAPARMEVGGLPAGARLRAEGIWVDEASGRAFPERVALSGTEIVTINGIRMAEDGADSLRTDEPATVLSAVQTPRSLLVRPADGRMPDLRVVAAPETEVVTAEGKSASFRLVFGDTVRVQGARRGRYLYADRVTVPAGLALREEPPRRGSPAPTVREPQRGPPPGRGNRGRERGRGRG